MKLIIIWMTAAHVLLTIHETCAETHINAALTPGILAEVNDDNSLLGTFADTDNSDLFSSISAELQEYMDMKLEEFKREAHDIIHSRKRRQAEGFPSCSPSCVNGMCVGVNSCECFPGWEGVACDTRLTEGVDKSPGEYMSPASSKLTDALGNATALSVFSVDMDVYVLYGGEPAKVFRLSSTRATLVTVLRTKGHVHLTSVQVLHSVVYLITSYTPDEKQAAPDLFRIDLSTGSWPDVVDPVMTVSVTPRSPSDFCFFQLPGKADGKVVAEDHLLITFEWLQEDEEGKKVPASGSDLYEWRDVQMDKYSTLKTIGATSCQVLTQEIYVYLAVSQYTDLSENYKIGTVVYRMSKLTRKIEMYQSLKSDSPTHLTLTSINSIWYLAITSRFSKAVIYQFRMEKFVEFQEFPSSLDGSGGKTRSLAAVSRSWAWANLQLPSGDTAYILATQSGQQTRLAFYYLVEADVMYFYEYYSFLVEVSQVVELRTMVIHTDYYIAITARTDAGSKTQFYLLDEKALVVVPPESFFRAGHIGEDTSLETCMAALEQELSTALQQMNNIKSALPTLYHVDTPHVIDADVVVDGGMVIGGTLVTNDVQVGENGTLDVLNKNIQDVLVDTNNLYQKLDNVLYPDGSIHTPSDGLFLKNLVADSVTIDNLNDATVNGENLMQLFGSALRYSIPQTITGFWMVKHLKVHSLKVDKTIGGIHPNDFMLADADDQVVRGRHVYSELQIMGDITIADGGEINQLPLDNIVVSKQGTQTVHGHKVINSIVADGDISVANYCNGKDLKKWLKEVVTLDTVQFLSGKYTFSGGITVGGNLQVGGEVCGVGVDQLFTTTVTKDTEQTIYGEVVHNNVNVVGDFIVGSKLNGVKIPWDLLTVHTDQNVSTPMLFKHCIIHGDLNSRNINNVDANNLVTTSKTQYITGYPTFTSLVTIKKNLNMTPGTLLDEFDPSEFDSSLRRDGDSIVIDSNIHTKDLLIHGNVKVPAVNDHNIDDLLQNYWRKSKIQKIPGTVTWNSPLLVNSDVKTKTINDIPFSSFIHSGSNNIDGTVFKGNVSVANLVVPDGVKIGGVDLSKLLKECVTVDADGDTISGKKIITANVDVKRSMDVTGTLNGLNLETDLLRTDSPLPLRGKVFEHVLVYGDMTAQSNIEVEGKVNTYDLKQWKKNAVFTNEDHVFNNNVHFDHIEAGNINVGKVDGVDVRSLLEEVVWLDKPNSINSVWTVNGDVIFNKNVATSGSVNNKDYEDYIMNKVIKRTDGELIRGHKEFRNTFINGDLDCKTLNRVDLAKLAARLLSTTKPQKITANYTFNKPVNIDSLKTPELGGVRMDDVAYIDEATVMTSAVSFTSPITIQADLHTDTGFINSCNISDLMEILQAALDQRNTRRVNSRSLKSVTVLGDAEFLGLVDGVNITDMMTHAVTKHSEQVITRNVQFMAGLEAENLYVKEVNDNNLKDVLDGAVRLSKNQVLHGIYHFTNPVKAGHVTVKGNVIGDVTVDGTDLKWIKEHAIFAVGQATATGLKKFTKNLRVENLILSNTGKINGISPDAFVVIGGNVSVGGVTTFHQPITVEGDMFVGGLVDGVDLLKFIQEAVSLDKEQEITGNIQFMNELLFTEGIEAMFINGIPLQNVVTRSGSHRITGKKHFTNLTILGDLSIDGELNGRNFAQLMKRIALTDRNEVFTGAVTFGSPVYMLDGADIEMLGTFNNVKVSTLPDLLEKWKTHTDMEIIQIRVKLQNLQKAYQERITQQQHLISMFEYFEEFQQLETGGFEKFYTLDTTVPSIFGFQRTGKCDVKTLRLSLGKRNQLGEGQLVDNGRLFQFLALPSGGYKVKTDGSYGVNCTKKNSLLRVETLSLSALTPHTEFIRTTSQEITLQTMEAETVADVKIFHRGSVLYMVVARYYNPEEESSALFSEMYTYDKKQKSWILRQSLDTAGAHTVELVVTEEYLDIVILNTLCNFTNYQCLSDVYRLNENTQQFTKLEALQSETAVAVRAVYTRDYALIIIAQEKWGISPSYSHNVDYTTPVRVYRYFKDQHRYFGVHSLNEYGVSVLETFNVGGEAYLVTGSSRYKKISIFQWRGAIGFTLVQKIPCRDVQSILSYTADDRTYLLVSDSKATEVYKAKETTSR